MFFSWRLTSRWGREKERHCLPITHMGSIFLSFSLSLLSLSLVMCCVLVCLCVRDRLISISFHLSINHYQDGWWFNGLFNNAHSLTYVHLIHAACHWIQIKIDSHSESIRVKRDAEGLEILRSWKIRGKPNFEQKIGSKNLSKKFRNI